MNQATFKIYTLGCKVNFYDSETLAKKFIAVSFLPVKKDASLAVVNSCSVTKTALRKVRQAVAKARRENPVAKIVLTGCMVKTYGEEAKKLGVDLVWAGNSEELIKKITNSKLQIPNKIQNSKSQIRNKFKIQKSKIKITIQN